MERVGINPAVAVSIAVLTLLLLFSMLPSHDGLVSFTQESANLSVTEKPQTYNATTTPTVSTTVTPKPTPTKTPTPQPTQTPTSAVNPYPFTFETPVATPPPLQNETFLLSAIKSLGAAGGQIVIENNLEIVGKDVLIPSNIAISGINPDITIFQRGKHLEVAANSSNVLISNLTIESSTLGPRYALPIREYSTNIKLENIKFLNYADSAAAVVVYGNQVTLNKLLFVGVPSKPILIAGSNVSVIDCYSDDNSPWGLVGVMGGTKDINIIGNTALNRPLVQASYGNSSKNINIEKNTVYFPNATYGLFILGGMQNVSDSHHENVTIRDNFVRAAPGAWNAIAVYGLTRNSLVVNNTVDMTLSGHNGIAISSGVNITVIGNTVFGSLERTEGGIEVESNPVHNRNVGFSENITVTGNTVYNSYWGIYVRVMEPTHPYWNGTILLSKNIIIDNNRVFDTQVGINLLQGENITVTNNDIVSNNTPFAVDTTKVATFTVAGNSGYP